LARGIERISRNWLLVKILRTGDLEYNILKKSVFDYTSKCIRSRVLAGISNQLPIFLGVVLAVVIIVLNDKYFQTQASAFVSFLYIFVRFSQSLGTLSGAVSNSLSYLPQYQMIEKFVVKNWSEQTSKTLDETSEIRVFRQTGNKTKESLKIAESGEAAYSEREPPAIELKRVSFTYDFHNYVLEDFSLKVPKGSQCGIRGPSGSGKSTLLGLITGVIKPTSGDIRVDGEEPSKYFSNRSSQIGYVGPEPYMIEGTLLDNLNYGHRRTVNQTECLEVLEKVGLLPMFNSLRLGFDHPILENGDGLSAGQKQRLSLARALIGHPQILILDEASSNLDDESEKKIAETVDLLKGETTVVVVSHRAGLLKNADFVLDFSPGVK
jgi:ABC-type multidrug transport system fused ATPase/permease subunit